MIGERTIMPVDEVDTPRSRPVPSPPCTRMKDYHRTIAYFTMEIGVDPGVPTYSGGLGMLAGDAVRAAADLGLPMVAVTLLHRKGYFFQRLNPQGHQTEEPVDWVVSAFLKPESPRVELTLQGRTVRIAAWRYDVHGAGGATIPVYFLDTDLPENDALDRTITHLLYGGDQRYRLLQEAVLGIGGVKMLRALGHERVEKFHMNEGHAALLLLELIAEECRARQANADDPQVEAAVRCMGVFTTHTPVAAGHDTFPLELVNNVIGHQPVLVRDDAFCAHGQLNLTLLAMHYSGYTNGVSRRHGEVSRSMFHSESIDAVTNGCHPATWINRHLGGVLDRRAPLWRRDPAELRMALAMSDEEILDAHQRAKRELILAVNTGSNVGMDLDHFTIGFARRTTGYKRADLLLTDLDRLRRIAGEVGPVQIIYAGKAHPRDGGGKELIARIFAAVEALRGQVRMVYLPNYDFKLCRLMVAGVDLWLNNPLAPLEASGTSGMKAAMNGVPSLSTLDGWWIEGCVEGVTGWAINTDRYAGRAGEPVVEDREGDMGSLYDKLEHVIVPMFYRDRAAYADVMRHCIGVNGPHFSAHRMMQEYTSRAYAPRC